MRQYEVMTRIVVTANSSWHARDLVNEILSENGIKGLAESVVRRNGIVLDPRDENAI